MLHNRAAVRLFLVCTVFFAIPCFASGEQLSAGKTEQSALIFSRSGMQEMMLPASIRAAGLPLIYSSQIRLACMLVPTWKGELLAFLPETSECIPFSTQPGASQLGFSIQIGRDQRAVVGQKISQELQNKPYLVARIAVQEKSTLLLQTAADLADVCGCPDNVAPSVNLVSGDAQQLANNTPIGNIVFSATDVDSDLLMDFFSYQFNGGSAIDGMPAGLSKSCSSGTGTLDCTVSGTSPGAPGSYSIIFAVYDGFNTTSLSASLTVTGSLPEIIFEHGFENTP